MNIKNIVALAAFICFVAPAAQAQGVGGGKRLILNLLGAGPMYESTVPDIDGDHIDDPAMCFDVEIGVVNGQNRQVIGTGTDCLSDVTPIGTGIALVGTTYFHLPQGTLITRGKTTVQPVLQPTETTSGQTITHATAASGTGNAIIGGTGRFARATGTSRLGGLVDLSGFGGSVGDPIFFDCLFIVDLD